MIYVTGFTRVLPSRSLCKTEQCHRKGKFSVVALKGLYIKFQLNTFSSFRKGFTLILRLVLLFSFKCSVNHINTSILWKFS